jgi:hypothetical protein
MGWLWQREHHHLEEAGVLGDRNAWSSLIGLSRDETSFYLTSMLELPRPSQVFPGIQKSSFRVQMYEA